MPRGQMRPREFEREWGVTLRQIDGKKCWELDVKAFLVLFSYETPVAYIEKETKQAYVTSKRHGATTSHHISQWFQTHSGMMPVDCDQATLDLLL